MKLRSSARLLLISLLSLMVSACSIQQHFGNTHTLDERAIAQNLLYTLSMLEEVSPWKTSVQFSAPNTSFGKHVESGLDELGYAVRRVSADQGKCSKTLPVSVLRIEGATVQDASLNDAIFESYDNAYSTLSFMKNDGNEVQVAGAQIENSNDTLMAESADVETLSVNGVEKKNMYETRRSNFSAIFANYEDVKREVLIFPNDSLFLGDENKAVIEQYANSVENGTDVISLIGCSHGNTALSNGNSLLALGRANRVKEALLYVGLPESQVLDEGCWAPVHFDEKMPRRGVVMTLKRLKS